MAKCSLVIREVKTAMRYYYILTRIAEIKKTDNIQCWQVYESTENAYVCW